jgi:hypothetical protein
MNDPRRTFTHGDYTVGWICALLEPELVAARAMLDEKHLVLPAINSYNSNSYVLGRISDYNIMVTYLLAETTGKVSTATITKDMIRSFPAIRFGLMVRIRGGAPYYSAGGITNQMKVKETEDSEDLEESDNNLEDIRDI